MFSSYLMLVAGSSSCFWVLNFGSAPGADMRYKPPITHTYRRKNKKKTAQPVALWMEHTSYWA